jgi:hypothetical protein
MVKSYIFFGTDGFLNFIKIRSSFKGAVLLGENETS